MPRPVAKRRAILHHAALALAEQMKAAAVQIRRAVSHDAALAILQHQPPARARALLHIVVAMAEAGERQAVDDHMLRAREQQPVRIRDRRAHRMTRRRQRVRRVHIQPPVFLILMITHQRRLHLRRAHLWLQRAKRAALKHRLRLLRHLRHKHIPQPRRGLEVAQIHIPPQQHTPRPPRPNRDRRLRRADERARHHLPILPRHDRERIARFESRDTLTDGLEATGADRMLGGVQSGERGQEECVDQNTWFHWCRFGDSRFSWHHDEVHRDALARAAHT